MIKKLTYCIKVIAAILPSHAGEEITGLLCIVLYHHEIVIELGEYGFDAFAEPLVGLGRGTPVFLIQPIRDLKRDVDSFKEILLNLSAEVTLVSKHPAIMIFSTHIIKIMEAMDTCGSHVIGIV